MSAAQQRLFIAAELPAGLLQELAALQNRLRRGNPPVRWVDPAAMHLTLWFFGDVAVEQIPRLAAVLSQVCAGRAAIHIRLGQVGAFPSMRRPSVVWAGLVEGEAPLREWYAALACALEPLGFTGDSRPYHPHLTLGRVRRDISAEQQSRLGEALQQMAVEPGAPALVRHMTLFQSELRPDGPRYTALATCDLASEPC